jgi:hypothetical protein
MKNMRKLNFTKNRLKKASFFKKMSLKVEASRASIRGGGNSDYEAKKQVSDDFRISKSND